MIHNELFLSSSCDLEVASAPPLTVAEHGDCRNRAAHPLLLGNVIHRFASREHKDATAPRWRNIVLQIAVNKNYSSAAYRHLATLTADRGFADISLIRLGCTMIIRV